MSSPFNLPRKGIFNHNAGARNVDRESPIHEGKRIVAAKIASSVGSAGAPTRVINAFLHVKDYTGLDRYLGKHKIPCDILTSSLQKVCMNSDVEGVTILAKHGANVNYTDQFGTTILHFAMRGGGNEQVIMALMRHGLDYCGWRADGTPLLHWACSRGQRQLVEYMVEQKNASLQEPDDNGRLPIHVAAVSGQSDVLSYLIYALSTRLYLGSVPSQFREALEDMRSDEEEDPCETKEECTLRVRSTSGRRKWKNVKTLPDLKRTAQTIAASNYLDVHQWTPLHHASCEEAIGRYQDCLKILLDNGADPMLPTSQGKTALDLAYGAGRSQVLVNVLPKRQLIALLMRIDDIVPPHVRKKREQEKELLRPSIDIAQISDVNFRGPQSFSRSEHSPCLTNDLRERTRKGYSFIRRLADNMDSSLDTGQHEHALGTKGYKTDSANLMSVWRKILLNDNVELLEALRDSLVWREVQPDSNITETDFGEALMTTYASPSSSSSMCDFETAQNLSLKQMSELFADCYENGTGVYSHIQANYQNALKANDFRSVLREMTGLLTFKTLSTNRVVVLRPMYHSLLFLALICGRFRVAEQLLRMRQFDVLPAAVLVTLILRRLRKNPSFPQQVVSELERFTGRIEYIAVDVLNLVSLKDNTPQKMICNEMLNVPLRSFGDLPLIDLFARAKCNELLSLPCCQRLLDERWHGVLAHLPGWMRWCTRLLPLTGLIYVECKTRSEREKARNLTTRAQSVSGASRQMCTHAENPSTTTPFNRQAQKRRFAPFSRKVTSTRPPVYNYYHKIQPTEVYIENPNDCEIEYKSCSVPILEPSKTLYDRIITKSESKASPRWYFITGVYRSPSMKFCLHSLFHLLFLFFFSVVCVYSLKTKVTIPEWISLAYVAGYAVEEARQIILEGLRDGLKEYAKDGWNWIDLLAVGLTAIGFFLRLGPIQESLSAYEEAHEPLLYFTRNLYMLGLNLFYMRTLYITSISQIIGPRLKMMADMLRKDLVPLLIVFAIFICSFGVWFQGLIHPNRYHGIPEQRNKLLNDSKQRRTGEQMDWSTFFKELFRRAFYSIFEVSIVLEETVCEENVLCGSEEGLSIVIYFVLVLYTGIVNIILINLLIALFSNTVSRIDQKATALWLAGRYKMVKEYSERTALPPPFNILCVLYEIGYCIFDQCGQHALHPRQYPPKSELKLTSTVRTGIHSDSDNSNSNEECEPGKMRDSKAIRTRLRHTRQIQRVVGSPHGVRKSDKWEKGAVLKFILLQSFALQDRRQMLGSGLGGKLLTASVTVEQPTARDQSQEISAMMTKIRQRIERLECKLDNMIIQLGKLCTEKSTKANQTMSPRRMPIPLRMPTVQLSRQCSDASETSIYIPTSQEIFTQLASQDHQSRRDNDTATPKREKLAKQSLTPTLVRDRKGYNSSKSH